MDLSYNKLTSEEAASQLETTDGWKIVSGALTKTFEFGSYSAGVLFGNAVAHAAEGLNHHPDLMIGYKRVTVSMVTHDAGGGLTAYDFELARRIDRLGS
ncbi:4a-hydroxytetrahydrobiopterin dehydratase [Kamptonema cortianum]|nr:4a-hydroxytetrahydrobiopterin dehydratase [Geitlerinema splendidum]MDK3155913.1 4a-hydroxytetrahydrobiopterin dehydratase [Kamptonema cortianum]